MQPIALHRVQFDLGAGALLDIEATLGRGSPILISWAAPLLVSAEAELDADKISSGGILPMRWLDADELFERFQLREDTDYFIDIRVPVSLSEAKTRSNSHAAWPFDLRLASVYKRDPPRRWKETEFGSLKCTTITGQLRLRSHAGVIAFSSEFGEAIVAEVACRKLNYFEEFKALLDSLSDKFVELLLAFDSPLSISFGQSDNVTTNDGALYFQMRRVMSEKNLLLAVEEILAAPQVRLFERVSALPIEEIEQPELELIDDLDLSSLSKGGPLARLFGGVTPAELQNRESFESADTAENRYAKAFLEHCRLIAYRLETRMAARSRRAAQREARTWGDKLDVILQRALWGEVGPLTQFPANSQVLLRKRGYKELFGFDLSLRLSLALPWTQGAQMADGLIGDIRPVSQIYEYWCFFTLYEILRGICAEIKGGNFIVVSRDGLRVQLAKGKRSECRFEYISATGRRICISLFYNKRFQRPSGARTEWVGSYTAAFDPDFSIVAAPCDEPGSAHWLHFDAKYRLERQEMEELFNEGGDEGIEDGGEVPEAVYDAELARVHKREDLFKMHTYRDGILSTRGAYIVFPGDGVGGRMQQPGRNFFVRHPTALGGVSAYRIPSVGAFALTPNGGLPQMSAIRDLLLATFNLAGSGYVYAEEGAFF